MQHVNQCPPGHGLLSFPCEPVLEYLDIDLYCIIGMFVGYITYYSSTVVIQKQDAKLGIVGAYLLGNVDVSFSAREL